MLWWDLGPRLALIGAASLRIAEEDDWPQRSLL